VRYIWTLATKDLLQTRRDRMAALFTIILPIVFTVFFGLLFGGLSSGSERIPLAIADSDGGAEAQKLVALLKESPVVDVKMVQPAAVEKQVDDEKVAAALVIPAGFSAAVEGGSGATAPVVRILGSTGAISVEEAVRSAVDRLVAERVAGAVAADTVAGSTGDPSGVANAAQIAGGLLAKPVLTVTTQDSGSQAGQIPRGFDQSSPGMLINWIMFSLLTAATGLVMERKSGAVQRLLTTHATRRQVIAGKAMAMFIITMIQQVLLIGLGQLVFGVDYLRDPPALLLTMITLSAMASCLGLLLATVFRSEQAVIATTVIVSMVLSALGGAWFPLEVTGAGFTRIAHLVPTSWILEAFRGIILKGWGVPDVLMPLGIVWMFTLVFFGLAAWRFRFE
jgi:ABC-2 type transport system permease protein